MKKIIFLICSVLFINNVNAYTYYTTYETKESDKVIEETDLVKLDSTLYIYYHEDKQLGPYLEQTNEVYKYLDKNDYIEFKSDLLNKKPENKDNRTIYEITDNFTNAKVYKIVLNNVETYDSFILSNLIIKYKETNINYLLECNCLKNDNQTFELNNNSKIEITLNSEYNVEDLDISFNVSTNKKILFDINLLDINNTRKYYKHFILEQDYKYDKSIQGLNYVIENTKKKKLYYYIDKYYRSYNKIIYYSDYLKDKTDYYNLKTEQVKYIYKIRDKLELEDKLLIDNINYNLKDFIISNTKDVEVIDNIDKSQDGLYEVIYKMNNQEIKVYVTLDINKNDYNKMVDIVNNFSNLNKTNNQIITNLNNENNLLNQKMDLLTKSYENKIMNLKSQKKSVKQIEKTKTNYIPYIIVILIILFLYKKKDLVLSKVNKIYKKCAKFK